MTTARAPRLPRTAHRPGEYRLERVHNTKGDRVYRVCTGGLFHAQRIYGYVIGHDGRWYVRRSMTAPVELVRACDTLRQAVELCTALWEPVTADRLYRFRRGRRAA